MLGRCSYELLYNWTPPGSAVLHAWRPYLYVSCVYVVIIGPVKHEV